MYNMHEKRHLDIIELFDNHLDRFVDDDELVVFHDVESKDNHIDIYWIKPNKEYRPYSILMTVGMSRFPMNVPTGYEDKRLIELSMLFPKAWDFSNINSKPDTLQWPIHHLRSIGKMPISKNTWIGFGHTISYHRKESDLFPGTRFSSTIILPSIHLPETFIKIPLEKETISIYTAIPLYPEELDYKNSHDTNSLIEKLNDFKIQEIIDIDRINTCS